MGLETSGPSSCAFEEVSNSLVHTKASTNFTPLREMGSHEMIQTKGDGLSVVRVQSVTITDDSHLDRTLTLNEGQVYSFILNPINTTRAVTSCTVLTTLH